MITRGPRSIIAGALACTALLFGTVGCSSDDAATDRPTTTVAGTGQDGTGSTSPGGEERGLPAQRDRQDAPAATVDGELTGGGGAALTDIRDFDLEGNGFVQHEFAVEGTATSYVVDDPATDLPGNGEFNLKEGDTADYRTRIVVRRPEKAEDFNGTVVLEWLNVSGGIDANAVLRLVEDHGLEETRAILNFDSGLRGLGGKSDMRRLMLDHTAESDFAIDHFCYWSLRHAGSLIAALEGVDAIAFTGGIGENAAGIRARILRGLEWLGVRLDTGANDRNATRLHAPASTVSVWIVPAREEEKIARDALTLMAMA